MRYFLILVMCLCLVGCGKDTSLIYKKSYRNFDIYCYRPIEQKEEWLANIMFNQTMKSLNQKSLRKRFKIKIVHNRVALKKCYGKGWESGTNGFYHYGKKEIFIYYHQFDPDTISHEMVHAITHINKLSTLDTESLAYYIGEQMWRRYIWVR